MAEERVVSILSPEYPWRLRALEKPPEELTVRGELAGAPSIAIVGTRNPSEEAAHFAYDLASRVTRAGAVVWSGGAVGIDAAAHRGAMSAGGRTVVVMGTGADHCFPSEHQPLYEEVIEAGGALLYPFVRRQPPTTWTFLQRNGVLVALSDALIVVQAPLKSGARSAARWARELGRPLFVVPASPWDELGAGNLEELRGGARILGSARDLGAELGLPLPSGQELPCPRRSRRKRKDVSGRQLPGTEDVSRSDDLSARPSVELGDLSPSCQAVLRVVSVTPQYFDAICDASGLPAPLVQQALLTLTLRAVLVEGPSGAYKLASH